MVSRCGMENILVRVNSAGKFVRNDILMAQSVWRDGNMRLNVLAYLFKAQKGDGIIKR